MNVLVTGGAGFIGTNLIRKLLDLKHNVYSIDNYTTGSEKNHQQGCTYFKNDIREVTNYSIDFDVIFHLAAIARIQPSFDDPKNYFTTNVNGTINLIEYCRTNDVPIIYAGTSSVHSGRFKNPYTFSKDIAEDVLKLYQDHYNLKCSIARFYNVYGDYELTEGTHTTLIGRWIYNIKNNIQCEIYGDGEQRRDFTNVHDIVDALVRIMDQQAYGYSFELGRGQNFSVNDIAKMFNLDVIYKNKKKGEARNTLSTDTTAKDVLGWIPTRNVKDYIKTKI